MVLAKLKARSLLCNRRADCTKYAYDAAMNRKLMIHEGKRTTYAYDTAYQLNRLHDANGLTTIMYDNNANIALIYPSISSTLTYSYDNENCLKQTIDGSTTTTSVYNFNLQRILQNVNILQQVKFIYDQGACVRTESMDAVIYTLNNEAVAISDGLEGYAHFYHLNDNSSITPIMSINANNEGNYIYDYFGRSLAHPIDGLLYSFYNTMFQLNDTADYCQHGVTYFPSKGIRSNSRVRNGTAILAPIKNSTQDLCWKEFYELLGGIAGEKVACLLAAKTLEQRIWCYRKQELSEKKAHDLLSRCLLLYSRKQKKWRFYIKFGDIDKGSLAERCADTCGLLHVDIVIKYAGTAYNFENHYPLKPRPNESWLDLSQSSQGILGCGNKAGDACSTVSAEDIIDCIRKHPYKAHSGSAFDNCQTQAHTHARDCCLSGYTAVHYRSVKNCYRCFAFFTVPFYWLYEISR